MVTDCLVDARPIDGEFRVVRPDGAVRTVHMMGEPVLDADGSTASMWAVLRDVSELRRSQRAVSETHDWLRYPPPPPWHGLLRFPEAGRPGLDLAAVHLPPTSATGRRSRCEAWSRRVSASAPATKPCSPSATSAARRPRRTVRRCSSAPCAAWPFAGTRPTSLPDRLAQLLRDTALPPVHGAVYCGFRPDRRTLTWAHDAGPAPLLFRGGTGRALTGQDGPSGQAEATLEAGDLLLLHTGAREPAAVEHLLSLAPRLTGADSAQDAVRLVARELVEVPGRQDACVLMARVTS
ncbi:PAS domain-containing protein OS=Streptomyces tendae OX=1932 GN=GUR47_35835 PE=4 SV=1 [Streptomyces tendae]